MRPNGRLHERDVEGVNARRGGSILARRVGENNMMRITGDEDVGINAKSVWATSVVCRPQVD